MADDRERVRALEEDLARARDENRRLREMLREVSAFEEFAPDFPPDRLLPAPVALRGDSDPLRESVTLAAGRDQGVAKGDPVLHGRSLVGVVEEVSRRRSSVRLVTDPACRIRAFGIGFRSEVMVQGRGKDQLRIRLQSRLVQAAEGEEILTAEEGKIPRGLIVGKIVREGEAEIEPTWRARDLQSVLVLIQGEGDGQ